MRPDELNAKSKKDLLDLARKHEVPGRSGMSKEELVRAIAKATAASAPRSPGAGKQPAKASKPAPKRAAAPEKKSPRAEPPAARREMPPQAKSAPRPPAAIRPESPAASQPPPRPEPPPPPPPRFPAPPQGRPVAPPRSPQRPPFDRDSGPRRGGPPIDPALKLSRVEEIRKSSPGRGPRPGRRPHEQGPRGMRGGPPDARPMRGGDRFPPKGGPRIGHDRDPRSGHLDERALQAREHLRRTGEARHQSGYTPQFDRTRDRDRDRDRGRGHGRDRGRDRERDRDRSRREPSRIEPPRTAPIPERFTAPAGVPPQAPQAPERRPDLEQRTSHPAELPAAYGIDRIVMMVRDPYWIHSYWEVTGDSVNRAKEQLGERWDGHRWILRVRSYTGEGEAQPGTELFDIDVNPDAKNWYIRVPQTDCSYDGMIGVLTRDGTFYPFARSNRVHTPRDTMSSVLDVQWSTTPEEFEKIYTLSGGYRIGASSGEVGGERSREREEAWFSGMLGSMGSGALGGAQRRRGFWFQVNTELIVYGATEPDAKVTVQGRQIALRPDGTFTLRFQLPDGVEEIPCVATSADGLSEKTITPVVRRNTTSADREKTSSSDQVS